MARTSCCSRSGAAVSAGGGGEQRPQVGDAGLGRHLVGAAGQPVPVDAVVRSRGGTARTNAGEHGDDRGGEQGHRAAGDDDEQQDHERRPGEEQGGQGAMPGSVSHEAPGWTGPRCPHAASSAR